MVSSHSTDAGMVMSTVTRPRAGTTQRGWASPPACPPCPFSLKQRSPARNSSCSGSPGFPGVESSDRRLCFPWGSLDTTKTGKQTYCPGNTLASAPRRGSVAPTQAARAGARVGLGLWALPPAELSPTVQGAEAAGTGPGPETQGSFVPTDAFCSHVCVDCPQGLSSPF